MAGEKTYIAIDLKSFYASVECMERALDPMTTNLVVADESRTEKTICLAVSPSLKAYGIPGRARLFEVVQKVKEANALRQQRAPGRKLEGSSWYDRDLKKNPNLAIDYLVAPPRMGMYVYYSTKIYEIYLKFVAPEDIHVYSIDEVFIDATPYLKTSGLTARQFAKEMILEVWRRTCITATAGIGTNLYLCKVAMDIVAKHVEPDAEGMRIAELNERSYREQLWDHRPLTDFWRVGRGYAAKLEQYGLRTMGDIARCSLGQPGAFYSEDLLYGLFGINAELLIDHAWGWEPVTLSEIKAYRPTTNSISSGQVLTCPYPAEKARLVVREMADLMALDLVEKGLVTDQLVLTVGYDIENLKDPVRKGKYQGQIQSDAYGRKIPKHAHGTVHLPRQTASSRWIIEKLTELYDQIVDPNLLIRRLTVVADHVVSETAAMQAEPMEQLNFFQEACASRQQEDRELEREKRRQQAILAIKHKFGKNAILKGMNLEEGATARERNSQIGGHRE